MTGIRKALLGMHDDLSGMLYRIKLKQEGYEVSSAKTVDEMKGLMGITPEGSQENFFNIYIMDVNLGYYGAYRNDSANEILNLVRGDYEGGRVKFMAVSGNPKIVENARTDGIPCLDKGDKSHLEDILDFIKS